MQEASSKYSAAYFIRKFRDIPESEWSLTQYGQGALNHCEVKRGFFSLTPEARALLKLFIQLVGAPVTEVNDGLHVNYQQLTPKKRIIAALEDARELEKRRAEIDEYGYRVYKVYYTHKGRFDFCFIESPEPEGAADKLVSSLPGVVVVKVSLVTGSLSAA